MFNRKMIKKIDTIDEGLYAFLSNDDTYSGNTQLDASLQTTPSVFI
jgi:hypothetical protein